MKIAIAQINCTVGDLTGNTAIILAATEQAKLAGADLVITPELALCGYPPQDLLLRTEFYLACNRALTNLVSQVKDITLLVGHPHHEGSHLYNAASLVRDSEIIATHYKQTLLSSPFFNESNYFDAGTKPSAFVLNGVTFGVNICADFWQVKQLILHSKQISIFYWC